ncbi:NADP-specific glutamate dehydrogenase [Carboxylicivirga sp. A043]|uniref:NADP-specific glutamate dehydrogenase n=1 Tax=Carboxylicivirga litoralis TaxID=2816963 RepID=UPI0021CAFCD2|nr:NADP-specific glutamate dehydrogenase [Carboxylicivirga sp. A043]MCU4157168.1 NADP-specific glutamate dehydrogenase [Carboxylicivirga sp. A043]
MNLDKFLIKLQRFNSNEQEFIQSVRIFLSSVQEWISDDYRLKNAAVLERLTEPDRVLMFKVPWLNDEGKVIVNRGYRVQYNNTLGPYKGGLRFHPALTLGTVKMLAFEQVFKNSLTSLPLGGAMGGANFDPKGKSEAEIMRFCQSYLLQLWDVLGDDIDILGGDIGVGSREIGYMFGMFKKLSHKHNGTFTGKSPDWGGTKLKAESHGFGVVYFLKSLLSGYEDSLAGKRIAISGFGNMAYGVIKKANALGAKVVTVSGPDGYVYDPNGIDEGKLEYLLELRATSQDLIRPYSIEYPGTLYHEGKKPWEVECDIAIPCAIQNEIGIDEANSLIENKCTYLIEGADQSCSEEAVELFAAKGLVYVPSKATNVGGVAISSLELAQNNMKVNWSELEVDKRLQDIMEHTYDLCRKFGLQPNGQIDYLKGANVASFQRVTEAMIDQGVV